MKTFNGNAPITPSGLRAMGFQESGLFWSKLLKPIGDGAIVEMILQPPSPELDAALGVAEPGEDWTISLCQGLPDGDDQTRPDDHVTITSMYPKTTGEIAWLLAALEPKP